MAKIAKPALSELMEALGEARAAARNAYEAYKEVKSVEDELRYKLELELKVSGLKSAKGKHFTVTMAERPTIVIQHETSVIEWIRNTPDIESDQYIGIKTQPFQTLAKAILKDTGEIIPGTELETREYLSIRDNKK